jgi:hypothetical protein
MTDAPAAAEGFCDGAPDAGAGAGDDGHLAAEADHVFEGGAHAFFLPGVWIMAWV